MAEQLDYTLEDVTADLARLRVGFGNVYFVGAPGAGGASWALVDSGLAMGAAHILNVAAERFGVDARPAAIVLTHGHFDHVGALEGLLAVWDVPIYAHTAELPFLTGAADYPPHDPTVGGGIIARISPTIPERGIDLGDRVYALPETNEIPGLPGWRWIHTPGHSPGHISLFRESDRMLISGDAVSTVRQDAAYEILSQPKELSGPPASLTIDWDKAERSITTLASLKPKVLAPGHGDPMNHAALATDLAALARDFSTRVRPSRGRYVNHPAIADDEEIVALPAPSRSGRVRWGALSGVAAATFAGTWLYRRFGRRNNP